MSMTAESLVITGGYIAGGMAGSYGVDKLVEKKRKSIRVISGLLGWTVGGFLGMYLTAIVLAIIKSNLPAANYVSNSARVPCSTCSS